MLELLSPAGSMDCLRAAVQNGADAVYLGYGTFNARQQAKNFAGDELQNAVQYCHTRGVKVHLTLNTLASDRELPAVAETIETAALAGVDAFIVQDFGIVSLCRRIAPDISIHASTQMSIHSLEGVRQAAAMGIDRVVLSRELSRQEIAYICRNSPVEIEVFVHGAFCMCYSGQCYMSSVIGRRSGNRGQCAQPCRLPYGYGHFSDKYPLSLKDNCLVAYLRELEQMGVCSVKIEGRMKRPEYVATATRIYRGAINTGTVSRDAMQELRDAFSRQGFTDGYYTGTVNKEMFGTRVAGKENKALFQAARASYENGDQPMLPVQFYAIVNRTNGALLAVQDADGHICKTQGPMPQEALTKPLTKEELTARLSKTGGTPYYCTDVRAVIEPGLSLPASSINAMRRAVLAELNAVRGRSRAVELGSFQPLPPLANPTAAPKLTISVLRADQVTKKMLALQPARLYVPLSELVEHPQLIASVPAETELAAVLPRVIWDSENSKVLHSLDTVYNLGIRKVLVGNLGQISLARSRGFEPCGDFGLNLYNSRAMEYFYKQGLSSVTASFEMTLPQIRDLRKQLPTEMLVYGRLPLMLTEHCLIKNRTGACACQSGSVKLVDRMGEEFRVVRDPGSCRSVILNGKKLFLLDKQRELKKLGLWALRLMFTTENPGEVNGVLAAYQSSSPFEPGSCTRGLYTRGVE
ncbi:MAG: DUF3656 domain-containing protein [Clostridia bacterium]|nr:DUF3656 domain-containing protein [Clostridia bacterium]